MDEKIIQSTKEYRKLPVRALRCMYTADLVAGLIVLAVIGAVNYFSGRYRSGQLFLAVPEGYNCREMDLAGPGAADAGGYDGQPIDQAFHVAKVIVTTGGGDVTLSFLEEERAEQIADSLRKRINEIVLEQRSADERKENIQEDGKAYE